MIDFREGSNEWLEDMNIVMRNVNLIKIDILDNTTMIFEFANSFNGEYYKKILCHLVWKFSSDIYLSIGDGFPFFICDIRILQLKDVDIASAFERLGFGLEVPESNEYYLLCMDSGDISISLICGSVEMQE